MYKYFQIYNWLHFDLSFSKNCYCATLLSSTSEKEITRHTVSITDHTNIVFYTEMFKFSRHLKQKAGFQMQLTGNLFVF